jgi:hypothetical protein
MAERFHCAGRVFVVAQITQVGLASMALLNISL